MYQFLRCILYMNIIKLMLYNDKIKCIIKGRINFIGRMKLWMCFMQCQARSFDKYMQTAERRGKRKMAKTKDAVNDMTVGKPAKLIIQFMIPVFLGNIFQQFYNIADSIVE